MGWRICSSSMRYFGFLRFVYLWFLCYNFCIVIGVVVLEVFVGWMCVLCFMYWGCFFVICECFCLFRLGFWGDVVIYVFVWWFLFLIRGYVCDMECDWLLFVLVVLGVFFVSLIVFVFFIFIWLVLNFWL